MQDSVFVTHPSCLRMGQATFHTPSSYPETRAPAPACGPHMAPRALFVFALGVQLCPLTSDLELFVPAILGLSSWLSTK